MHPNSENPDESWLNRWLSYLQNAIYVTTSTLLVLAAAALLMVAAWTFVTGLGSQELNYQVLIMLDQLLLVMMLVELLDTVRVTLYSHSLLPEPFLIVALIAAMRRILVITAEVWHLGEIDESRFDRAMLELGLLTILTLILVISIVLLRRLR
jgi:uncharacterized membrane protein (DUF373 family)